MLMHNCCFPRVKLANNYVKAKMSCAIIIFVMKRENKFNLELFFAALATRTRLRLLNLMRDGEVCVCFFAETLSTNNPKISRHLSYLKRANS
jgi:DNA-binding transcriptional ArsR family regulator